MSLVPVDTLKLAVRLEDGGLTVEQARVAAAALADAMARAELATKADMLQMEQRLTIRPGGMLIVAATVLLAAIRYLPSRHP